MSRGVEGPAARPAVAACHGLQVLVVDDVPVNRDLLSAVVCKHGHVAQEAADGQTAVERVAAGGIDLVLMDIEMPSCDGLEATQRIRALPAPACGTMVWLVTAHTFPDDIERSRAAGANGHLSKPVDLQALLTLLQAVHSGARPAIAAGRAGGGAFPCGVLPAAG
jgi:CheY-like chemotaxis protein